MNTYLPFIMNSVETASAATTAAVLNLNQSAFTAYAFASETLTTMNWQPFKEVLDTHWGRFVQMNPILYLYPFTILLWAFLVYTTSKRNERIERDEFGEMKITIYTRGRPGREWSSVMSASSMKDGHRMIRRSMNADDFYELK